MKKGDKQKWYDDTRTPGDHNAKYLNKIKTMKEQLQKDGQGKAPSIGRGDHSRHRTHPLMRPNLTRHMSLNLPVFVTSADLASVPRAGRLSMYAKANKPVPAIHPVQGVGLLDDQTSRKGLKRTDHKTKRHNSLTSLDKVSADVDKGNQPPTLKRFARSQKPTHLSNRVYKTAIDVKDEQCMHLKSYDVACSHAPTLGQLRSRSSSSENESVAPSRSSKLAFSRLSTDARGANAKGKSASKYKPCRSNSHENRRVGLGLAPVKRSTTIDVPFGKGNKDFYDVDSSGYKAPVGTPYTVKSEKSDLECVHCRSGNSGASVRKGSSSTESSGKRPDTSDSDEWSDIGVTLSQIRLSHSQSEPSMKEMASAISDDIDDFDNEESSNRTRSATTTLSSHGSDDTVPIVQINSRSEAENEKRLENKVTINAPFIMFRPATPRMPEREEKTYDREVGHVLVKAATQADLRRKEMKRLINDIEEFNNANKTLYNKVNPVTG